MKKPKFTRRASGRRQAVERASLAMKAFDALPAHIAVVDEQGVILAANAAWDGFARASGASCDPGCRETGVGANYFDVCRRAQETGDEDAGQALAGMLDVLEGRQPAYELEYPCHSPSEKRWFTMRVAPLEQGSLRGVVIAHWPTTGLREAQQTQAQAATQAALAAAQAASDEERERERDSELTSLARLSGAPRLSVTGRAFALLPLYETSPAIFQHLVSEYESILKQALDEQTYKMDSHYSDRLRRMAEQLGFMRAGPRDVMTVHTGSLRELMAEWPPARAQALIQEGRLAVIELMGHLLNYYRRRAVMSATGDGAIGREAPGDSGEGGGGR